MNRGNCKRLTLLAATLARLAEVNDKTKPWPDWARGEQCQRCKQWYVSDLIPFHVCRSAGETPAPQEPTLERESLIAGVPVSVLLAYLKTEAEKQHARAERVEAENTRLRAALEGVKSTQRGYLCWCDNSHNAVEHGHQPKCLAATAALKGDADA